MSAPQKTIFLMTVVLSCLTFSLSIFGLTQGGWDLNQNGNYFTQIEDSDKSNIHLSHKWASDPGGSFQSANTLNGHTNRFTCTCSTAQDVDVAVTIKQPTGYAILIEAGTVECPASNPPTYPT